MTGLSVGLREGMTLVLISVSLNLVLYGLYNAGVIKCENEYTDYMNNTFSGDYNDTEAPANFLKTILNMSTNKCDDIPLWLYWVTILIFVLGIAIIILGIIPFT